MGTDLVIDEILPAKKVDGSTNTSGQRASGYGEPYVNAFDSKLANDEGSYWLARNATPGTGVAGHAAPTIHDTAKPFIMLRNAEAARKITLDFIKLLVTAAGTAGTVNYATHSIDKNRTFSAGGGDLTVVRPNLGVAIASPFTHAKIGAVVPGESNTADARIVAHQRVRTVIPVVGDELLFVFGRAPVGGGMVLEGTTELQRIIHCPPVVLNPGESYLLVLWRAYQSAAASYEAEAGGWVR